jgi:hypothetical protein
MSQSHPPLCLQCGVRPVKRCRASDRVTRRGPREIAGVRYRWFCSQACTGRATGAANMRLPHVTAAVQAHRTQARGVRLQKWIACARAGADAAGRVSLHDMVRILAQVDRGAYSRGYEAGRYRSRMLGKVA